MTATAKQLLHRKAVGLLQSRLCGFGHKTAVMPETNCKFDLLVNGKLRCEVKSAENMQTRRDRIRPFWQINLHRHGKLQLGHVDLYAIYLAGVPGFQCGIWLIAPANEIEGTH